MEYAVADLGVHDIHDNHDDPHFLCAFLIYDKQTVAVFMSDGPEWYQHMEIFPMLFSSCEKVRSSQVKQQQCRMSVVVKAERSFCRCLTVIVTVCKTPITQR